MTDPKQETGNLPAKVETTSTPELCRMQRDLEVLRSMPRRLNDLQLAEVEQIFSAPVPMPEMTDDAHLSRCLERMDANLKRKAVEGEQTVRLQIDTQRKVLGKLPKDQLSFITAEAIRRFTFFPTIAELLELGKEWKNPNGGAKQLAGTILWNERATRQREATKRLKYEEVGDDEIATWPEWLRDGLLEHRMLTKREDGTLTQNRSHLDDWLAFKAQQDEKGEAV